MSDNGMLDDISGFCWEDYRPRPEERDLRTAILFEENDHKFLYVSTLGAGCQGQALLVRQISDGIISTDDAGNKVSFFVRKRAKRRAGERCSESTPTEIQFPYPCPEKSVPVTHFWKPCSDHDRKNDFTSIQDFCNGGSLFELGRKFLRAHKFVPEFFLWQVFTSLCELMQWLHYEASPQIAHHDIHCGNIFLHYKDEKHNPEVFLGDFGYAKRLVGDDVPDDEALNEVRLDILRVTDVVLELAASGFGRYGPGFEVDEWMRWIGFTPYSEEFMEAIYSTRKACAGDNLNSRDVWNKHVRPAAKAAQHDLIHKGEEWSVRWTRPESQVSPLLLSDEDLANLGDFDHPLKYRILGDMYSDTTDSDKGKLGIIAPFSYVLVKPDTLEVIRERKWQEIASIGVVYGTRYCPLSYHATMNLRQDRGNCCNPLARSEYGEDEDEDEEAEFITSIENTSESEQARQRLIDDNKPDMTLSYLIRVYEALPSNDGSQMSIFQTAPNSPIPPEEETSIQRPFYCARAPSPPMHTAQGIVGGWTVVNPPAAANICTPISII